MMPRLRLRYSARYKDVRIEERHAALILPGLPYALRRHYLRHVTAADDAAMLVMLMPSV